LSKGLRGWLCFPAAVAVTRQQTVWLLIDKTELE
jgi:hypothetical protein